MIESGNYIVEAGGNQHETLRIDIIGNRMTVDSPYWFGHGMLYSNKYKGNVIYKHKVSSFTSASAIFHTAEWVEDHFNVEAWFEGHSEGVNLTWTPV